MKLFSIEEANKALKDIQPLLVELKNLHKEVINFRQFSKKVSQTADLNRGTIGGSNYVKTLFKISEISNEFNELGIQIKDFSRGLIDFPSWRDDRIILLCWQLGEGEKIEWWHEIEDGFKGRQKL